MEIILLIGEKMKQIFICLIILTAFYSESELLYAGNWNNALAPNRTNTKTILFADKKNTEYRILLPTSPNTKEQKAAELLSKSLNIMTGAEFNIIREKNGIKPVKPLLSIGKTELYKHSGITPKTDMQEEGYCIAEKDGDLFFVGGIRRGPINAVIALLSEDLGCRWYAQKTKPLIPFYSTLFVEIAPRCYVPKLKIRELLYWEAWDSEWALMNRLNPAFSRFSTIDEQYGGAVNYPTNCFVHTYWELVPPVEHFQHNPEYYAYHHLAADGKRKKFRWPQLCLSNQNVVKAAIAGALNILEKNPDCELLSVSQNDFRGGFCECHDCEAMNKRLGGKSGSVIEFAKKVQAGVRLVYPNVRVSTLAYQETFLPSAVVDSDGIIIMLCTDTHALSRNNLLFDVTETDQFINALHLWHQKASEIHLWDYTIDFHDFLRPLPNINVINRNIDIYMKNNVSGLMMQGDYRSPGSPRAALRCWVFAQKMWNPMLNIDALVKDFTLGYFGPAGEEMQKYNELLKSEWEQFHAANKPGTRGRFSEQFLPCAQRLFDDALGKVADNPELLRRVRREKLSVLYTRLEAGLNGVDDIDSYSKDIAEFMEYVKLFNITHYREKHSPISDKVKRWRSKIQMEERVEKTSPDSILLGFLEAELVPIAGFEPKIIKDKLSFLGSSIRQPGSNLNWSVQWDMNKVPFKDNTDYMVRFHCRIDKTSNKGRALSFGCYDANSKQTKYSHFTAQEINNNKYSWLSAFTLPLSTSKKLFVRPCNNVNISAIYIDAVELIPGKEMEK